LALALVLGLGPAAAQAQAGPEAALPTLEAELEAGRRSLQQLEIRLKAEAEARRAELATLEAQQRRLQDDIAARRQAEERLGAEAAARIAAARRGVQQAEEQVARARQRAAEAAERQRREEEARRVAQARQPVIPPGTEKRVALVVGNAAYRDRPLANPVNDAQLMQATLRELGFDVQMATDVDRRGLLGALREFEARSRGADVAFFYYAGHGAQVGGANYLIPLNAPIRADSDVPDEAVDASSVLRRIEDARAKVGLVVLDACRDNPYPGASRSTARGLARMNAPTGTIVAYATAPGSTAEDGAGTNSPYTATLAQQLRVPGLDVKDIFDRTAQEVERLTNGKQRPREEIALRGRFVLLAGSGGATAVASSAPSPAPPDPEVDLWELAKRRDNAASYEAYLQAYPQGRYAAAARGALAGLMPAVAPVAAAPAPAASPSSRRDGEVFKDCAECPEMVVIPAGRFLMGSPASEAGRSADEGPQRWVDVPRFALGRFEVTQRQWEAVMGSNPSSFRACGPDCPVENVSWNDAQEFVRRLSQRTGQNYRLPSEAEWEYAARAGSATAYPWGERASRDHANYGADICCSGRAEGRDRWVETAPVGQFPANAFGLHDMHGNLWEWVQDVWHDNYAGAPSDGSAWMSGGDPARRVLRGGSWGFTPQNLRSAYRIRFAPDIRDVDSGFRIARTF
jgi:formylglycine-generating enzyme required for sulfatase activity